MTEIQTAPAAKAEWRRRRDALMRRLLAPPTNLTVSEWADRYRMLSSESSAEPGKWRTERAPYLRGIMDSFTDPHVERIVWMSSSQVGKTETLNNVVAFFIDQAPSPILVIQPTLDMARAWSMDRFAPMLRDTPRIKDKVRDARSRDSGNTILHKSFTGGHLTALGANSPSGLASRPIRVVLADEVDRYPASAGTEGDPIALAAKRTATFWNRKIGIFSTPTIKGFSRVAQAWEESDQRRYHVPCPHCGHSQTLEWGGLTWDGGKPETAAYACAKCSATIEEGQKWRMLMGGSWIAEFPGRRTAGFHLNALYSPWARWEELVREWNDAQGNPQRLQVFVNTVLGELWEESGEQVAAHTLFTRLEPYGPTPDAKRRANLPPVPSGGCVLTCGADVQGDRIEARTWGWGPGEESWLVDSILIPGDPGDAGPNGPWPQLDAYLKRTYEHEDGATLALSATFIDSGGHHTKEVYAFCRDRIRRRIFACKGSGMEGHPLLNRPTQSNSARVILFMVGVATAKDSFASQLRIQVHGPGYVHLPDWVDREELEQLTAEKKITRYAKGRPLRQWMKTRDRNEGLDCRIYAMGALTFLGPATLKQLPLLLERVRQAGARRKSGEPKSTTPEPAPGMKRAMAAAKQRAEWARKI